MIRIAAVLGLLLAITGFAVARDTVETDPGKLFVSANEHYQKQEYEKALGQYRAILDAGFESGRLYYNIGNCYFKLGKTGYAILYYEKALRLMPQDGDLRLNLAYARSSAGVSDSPRQEPNPLADAVSAPFRELSLGTTAVVALVLYMVLAFVGAAFILNPVLAKKGYLFPAAAAILAIAGFAAFGAKFYSEELRKHGIVTARQAECRYEPIDKSTVYYKLQEGDRVDILKTRNGWRRIKRHDGKIAWVEEAALDEI